LREDSHIKPKSFVQFCSAIADKFSIGLMFIVGAPCIIYVVLRMLFAVLYRH